MTPRDLRDAVLCCVVQIKPNQTKSNQRPSENEAFELVDGGDGCAALPRAYDRKTWVLLSANNCSAGAAAKHGASSGAGGVIIITTAPPPEAPCTNPLICPAAAPEELAACGSTNSNAVVTMVTHTGGAVLRRYIQTVGAGSNGAVNASLASQQAPGSFGAIDYAGHLHEVGWEKYSTLEMLAWSAQYLDYKQELEHSTAKPAYIVPIFDRAYVGAAVTIATMPSATMISSFSTMEIDMELTCAGNKDEDCPVWDHNIALGVVCAATWEDAAALGARSAHAAAQRVGEPGGFRGELGRWVTPFRRRIGRFLTPATHYMPLLTGANRTCAFHMSSSSPSWVATIALRFTNSAESGLGATTVERAGAGARVGAPPAVNTFLFSGGSFDLDYNTNRTLMVTWPPLSSQQQHRHHRQQQQQRKTPTAPPPTAAVAPRLDAQPVKVVLAFTLSGHGECEFMETTHIFTVNGVDFQWSSVGVAGTAMGCSTQVRSGRVQPNQHGTWYTGRNGWCNGADVPVHLMDVTQAIMSRPSSAANITYHAYVGASSPPGKQGGNIVLASSLAWYY